jgi:hypothetical protein
MAGPRVISQERAERIARSLACEHCLEYSFKRLVVRPASASYDLELKVAWIVDRVCGVCGLAQEIALDAEGDIVYVR